MLFGRTSLQKSYLRKRKQSDKIMDKTKLIKHVLRQTAEVMALDHVHDSDCQHLANMAWLFISFTLRQDFLEDVFGLYKEHIDQGYSFDYNSILTHIELLQMTKPE